MKQGYQITLTDDEDVPMFSIVQPEHIETTCIAVGFDLNCMDLAPAYELEVEADVAVSLLTGDLVSGVTEDVLDFLMTLRQACQDYPGAEVNIEYLEEEGDN